MMSECYLFFYSPDISALIFREGHSDIIEFLLDTSPGCWDTVSRNGRTQLHTAGWCTIRVKSFEFSCLKKQFSHLLKIIVLLKFMIKTCMMQLCNAQINVH